MQIVLYFRRKNAPEVKLKIDIMGLPGTVERLVAIIRKELQEWGGWEEL